ncbi:MAG: RNA methyltransferase [Bacteroidales bacterium]
MLSKNKIKHIVSLQRKKNRDDERLYVIEGDKIVKEFLGSDAGIVSLIAKPEYIAGCNRDHLEKISEVIPVSYEELKKLSTLKTPHNALAVVKMPEHDNKNDFNFDGITAALDFIQDPGNLGTIIRAAAWFGINTVYCSENCVDVYNPKVIQATMGAILNVRVVYTDMIILLEKARQQGVPVFGTLLDGENIYTATLPGSGLIILGNESRGISDNLLPFIDMKLSIPKFSSSDRGVESLNAGMAASVAFSEFARRALV